MAPIPDHDGADEAPIDATTVMSVSRLMAAVAIVAGRVPAWRAARVDPTTALPTE